MSDSDRDPEVDSEEEQKSKYAQDAMANSRNILTHLLACPIVFLKNAGEW
jgi:hypothetical protein